MISSSLKENDGLSFLLKNLVLSFIMSLVNEAIYEMLTFSEDFRII